MTRDDARIGPRRWPAFAALVFAALLAFVGSVAGSAEDAPNLANGRSSSSGHGAPLILFVVATVIGLIAIIRLVAATRDESDAP